MILWTDILRVLQTLDCVALIVELMGLIVVGALLHSAGGENLAQELYVMWHCEHSDHKHTTVMCGEHSKLAAIKSGNTA